MFLLGTRSLPALAGGCFSRVREVFICYLFRYFLGSFLSSSWCPCTANVGAFSVVPEVFSAVFFPRLSFFLLVVFCCSDLHRSVLQAVYPFFCLSYLAVDFLLVFHSSVCLFVSSCMSLVNFSCIFSEILDHLHHYSEFFFWKVACLQFI